MGFEINWLELELIGRILLTVILGAIIGFEREMTHKPAGFRTHIFMCMGACLFTIASIYLTPQDSGLNLDTTRIAAGIVTGTAFIGAGSIIARKDGIKGLTTAAGLWIVAAIGLMVGLGSYLLPIVTTIITFIILRIGHIADKKALVNQEQKKT